MKIYLNGTASATTWSVSDALGLGSGFGDRLAIGYNLPTNAYTAQGYIQDVRITRAARYTGNFTLPTAQFAYNQGDINYNQWVPTNFSVTAGAGNDSLLDVPTNWGVDTGLGGEVRGNYATLNPLDISNCTIRNGNLDITTTSGSWGACRATIGVSTGKWYWEVTATNLVTTNEGVRAGIGIATGSANVATNNVAGLYTGTWAIYNQGASLGSNGGSFITYGASWQTGDIIGIALDCDAGTLVFYKNGVSLGTAVSGLTSGPYFPIMSLVVSGAAMTANFGQRPFAYAAPSGFKSLNTHNLPALAVAKSNTAFDTVLYTGNGGTQNITSLGFQPDLVWIKRRDSNWSHAVYDSIRGAGSLKALSTNATDAEGVFNADTTYGYLSSFNSNGFTVINGTTGGYTNLNAATYAAWGWGVGTTTVVNNSGSVSSNVRVNTSAGISIVSYAGSQASTFTIGHGLLSAPSFIITKSRNAVGDWGVYYTSEGVNTNWLLLNSTASKGTQNGTLAGGAYLISNAQTLQISSSAYANGSSQMIAYCFAAVPGFSAFGTYTGNGSADGPFVYTGFRPAWIMIKRSDGIENWNLYDNKRKSYNVADLELYPNLSNSEGTTADRDFLSNGFKIRSTNIGRNASGSTYIYAAFAESPFKYARAR
jgi:hypothetical protein